MQVNKLTYENICTHAEDAYRTLFDRKEWPPAQHTHDSKAPPAAFGNMATPITRAEGLNLIHSKPSTDGAALAKKGVCHKSNKTGHWSRECPENNKGKGRNGNGNERPKDVKSWKSTLPPSGAPQVKQANGKAFNWCANCKRWTTTHTTATHTGGGKRGADGATNGGGTAINNVSLAFDPSVWTTKNEVIPMVTDALYVLRTIATRKFPVLFVLLAHLRDGNILSPVCKNYVEFLFPICKNYWDLNSGKIVIHNGASHCR